MELLQIPRALHAAILAHCRGAAPREAVGLLVGRRGLVTRAYGLRNVHPDAAAHFRVDPVDRGTVEAEAAAAGLQILAVYHSHPRSIAYPSAEDLRLAPAGVQLLIVSLATTPPDVRAYHPDGAEARPVPYRLRDDLPGDWVDLR